MDGVLKMKRSLISLDDIKMEFCIKEITMVEEQNVLFDPIAEIATKEATNEVEQTISVFENSLNSLAPKIPVVPEKKLEQIKSNAKSKLLKKSIKEELREVKYDKNPELANLENTIILNADILKKDIEEQHSIKDEEKNSNRSKILVYSLFAFLIVFVCTIPVIVQFV